LKGQPEIARILQVSIGTFNRDSSVLRQRAKDNIKTYIAVQANQVFKSEKTRYGTLQYVVAAKKSNR
jgi:hypothetical protein